MKTICQLLFPDGAQVEAWVENDSPEGRSAVTYTGAVERVSPKLEETDNATVVALFTLISRQTNAKLSVKHEGEYKEWAL